MAKFNPFRPNHIVRPGMFAGRLDELEMIEQSLFQTKHGNPEHFLIEGERGIGKSSLLLYVDGLARGALLRENNERFRFLVVSVELQSTNTYEDIIRIIATDLRRAIAETDRIKELARKSWEFLKKWEVLGVSYTKNETKLEPYELLENLVNTIVDLMFEAGGEIDGILLLIDEADKPPAASDLGSFAKLLTERLTRRDCDRVLLGFAGLPNLIPKLRESHESSPRVFTTLSLDPLEVAERIDVVHRGLELAERESGVNTKISKEAEAMISNLSEGYPHFIQEFAHCAFDQDDDDYIDADDVSGGAYKENGALEQLGHKYFHVPYFDQIDSDDYRKVLQAMADHLDGFVPRKKILKSSGVKEATLNNALRALKERNIILPNERKPGEYRLPTKSFAVWIKAVSAAEENGSSNDEPKLPLDD